MRFWPRRHVPLLITGHPRCGTTSAGEIGRSMGLDVGDEGYGRHGISSWMLAVSDRWSPYGNDRMGRSRRNFSWDWLVLVVRDLQSAIPSVIVENRYALPSLQYRRKHICRKNGIDISMGPDEFTSAVQSIVYWADIIMKQRPSLYFRIEDQQQVFRGFLAEKFDISNNDALFAENVHENANKTYRGQIEPRPIVEERSWLSVSGALKEKVQRYCSFFGYPRPPHM